MTNPIRWGILGCGKIAHKFATGLQTAENAVLTAVGSRSAQKTEAFGREFSAEHRHASYEALAGDPDVDVIYVATPHPMHKECSVMCLRAGKAVLCEKPFAINASEAKKIVSEARKERRFLMEAMWTRFLPSMVQLRDWLSSGVIGEVRMLQADFGCRSPWNPRGRLFDPELGGGALLDVGVYTVSLASMIFRRPPSRISSMAHIGKTGVDEQAAMIFGYDEGELAILSTAIRIQTAHEVRIMGTGGGINIASSWWNRGGLSLLKQGEKQKHVEHTIKGNGYNYEAEEVGRCLIQGKLESETMPLDETVQVMETMDQIRAQWGLTYPMES